MSKLLTSITRTVTRMSKEDIRKQVDYYFKNFEADTFLVNVARKNQDGYIPMETIAGFPKMQKMNVKIEQIVDALDDSTIVELDPTKTMLRKRGIESALQLLSLNPIGNYIGDKLDERESKLYKAAGILPYYFEEGQMYVLLGVMAGWSRQLTTLGGKREKYDKTAEDTAARECFEESSELVEFTPEALRKDKVFYYATGKFAIYFCEFKDHAEFNRKYAQNFKLNEMESLRWICVKDLLETVEQDVPVTTKDGKTLSYFPFARNLLNCLPVREYLKEKINSLQKS